MQKCRTNTERATEFINFFLKIKEFMHSNGRIADYCFISPNFCEWMIFFDTFNMNQAAWRKALKFVRKKIS